MPLSKKDINLLKTINKYGNANTLSYSGANIVAGIYMPPSMAVPATHNNGNYEGVKESFNIFGEMSTLSYSIHREKIPVRLLGSVNPVSITSSSRTIAGTVVFTVFDRHVLRQYYEKWFGHSRGLYSDNIPPFDIFAFFMNEGGLASYLAIWGVTLIDEGQIMSINDIYIENQMSFMARDITLMENVFVDLKEPIDNNLQITITPTPEKKTEKKTPLFSVYRSPLQENVEVNIFSD